MIFKRFIRTFATAAILACAIGAAAVHAAGGLVAAEDLAATGRLARERGVPVMLAFTQASCRYCAIAKRDYLAPMHGDGRLRARVLIREVDTENRAPMRDFEGRTVGRKAFSERYGVVRVPTVIVVDHAGVRLAGPVVGLLTDDFYRLYLERAVEEGLSKLRDNRRPG